MVFSTLQSEYPHANIYQVKRALLIPLRYVLLLLLLTVIISAYSIIVGSAVYDSLSDTQGSTLFLINLIQGLKFGLYIGGMLATIICLRSILSLKSYRGIALIVLFVVAAPGFFFGYWAVRGLEKNYVLGDSPNIIDLPENTIVDFDGGGIFFRDTEANALDNVVLYHYANILPNPLDPGDRNYQLKYIDSEDVPRLTYINHVIYDSTNGEIIVQKRSPYTPDGRALVIHSEDIHNSRSTLFSQTGLLKDLRESMTQLFSNLDAYADELSFRYIALVAGLMLYLFSTSVFLRLTRWPLINFMLTVVINAAGLLLTRIQDLLFIRELAGSFLQERALGYISPVILGIFALLFLITNSFLPSVKDWVREVEA